MANGKNIDDVFLFVKIVEHAIIADAQAITGAALQLLALSRQRVLLQLHELIIDALHNTITLSPEGTIDNSHAIYGVV